MSQWNKDFQTLILIDTPQSFVSVLGNVDVLQLCFSSASGLGTFTSESVLELDQEEY